MEQNLPDEDPQLGRFLTEHAATSQRFYLTAIGWGIPLLGFAGYLVWALFISSEKPREPGAMTFLGVGAILVWAFFTGMALWETGPTVRVYERGFLFGREPFLWDSIDAFYQQKYGMSGMGIPVHTSHEYTAVRSDGKKAKFYLGIERADELAATIEERISPRLMDAARRTIAAGKAVDFDTAQIDRVSMKYKPSDGPRGELLWTEFRDVKADGTEVHFRKLGAWFGFSLSTRKVANLGVMLTLIDELVAATRKESGPDTPKK